MQMNPKAAKARIRAELDAVNKLRENLEQALKLLDKKKIQLHEAYNALRELELTNAALDEIELKSRPFAETLDAGESGTPISSLFEHPDEKAKAEAATEVETVAEGEPEPVFASLLPDSLQRYR